MDFCLDAAAEETHVSLIDLADAGIQMRALVFDGQFTLNFAHATVFRPIQSLALDGGGHDPRFQFTPSIVGCSCRQLHDYATQKSRASTNSAILRLWEPQLAASPEAVDTPSTVCAPDVDGPVDVDALTPVVAIPEKTILITRRDDHNPFFQISNALNAWLLMRALGWDREDVRVVHMDGGYPSPVDELHHRLLSAPAKYPLLRGSDDLVGRKLVFANSVLIAPFETTGPMMQHLDDEEPCANSQLIQEFRRDAMHAMNVSEDRIKKSTQITVTIISRRNYKGRVVQRRWVNEAEVLEAMRVLYKQYHGVPIVVQSVDFVELSLAQQIDVAVHSDVIIGMHGAGMVNVLWATPETLVVEIFPSKRRRWGYRNLCQHVGCDWHEFRAGVDTGAGDNASDKTIAVAVWFSFFDAMFERHLKKILTTKQPAVSLSENSVR